MAFEFNPFTSNFDAVGAGGGIALADVDRLTSITTVPGSTLVLTSDGVDQTLTASLGKLNISTQGALNFVLPTITYNFSDSATFPTISVPSGTFYLWNQSSAVVLLASAASLSWSTASVLSLATVTGQINIGTTRMILDDDQLTFGGHTATVSRQVIAPDQGLRIHSGTSGASYPVLNVDYSNAGGTRDIFSVTQNDTASTYLKIAQTGIVTFLGSSGGLTMTMAGSAPWVFNTGAIIGTGYRWQMNSADVLLNDGSVLSVPASIDRIVSGDLAIGAGTATSWSSALSLTLSNATPLKLTNSATVVEFGDNPTGTVTRTFIFDYPNQSTAVATLQYRFRNNASGGTPAANYFQIQVSRAGATTLTNLASTMTITSAAGLTATATTGNLTLTSTVGNIISTGTHNFGGNIDKNSAAALSIGTTNATSIALVPATLNIGPDTTANPTVNFLGSTFDGSFRWQEASDYFWISDDIRLGDYSTGVGRLGIGTTPTSTVGINTSHAYIDVTGYGGDLQAHNRQTSTTTTYSAVGVRTQANVGTGVTTRGSATGGQFSARLNGWLGGSVVTSGEILGGRFAADTSGAVINFTYPSFVGGRFILQIGSATDAGIVTTGYCAELSYGIPATNSTFTNLRFINIAASSAFGAGSSVTNFDAIYIADQTNVSVTEANPRLLTVESQNGTSSGANKFNFVWEGGDWDTSHIQMGAAHWWVTSGATRLKTAVPTSATDYDLQVSATVLAPGTNGGLTLGTNGAGFGSLVLKDTAAAFELTTQFTCTAISADRTLTIDLGDAARTLTIGGNASISQNYLTTGAPQFARLGLGTAADGTRVLKVSDAAAAPTANATPVFTFYYGGNTNALGDPTEWIYVQTAAGTRKIPCYA